MFGPMIEAMGGKKFCSDEEVQQAVHEWLHKHKDFSLEKSIHFVKAGGPVLNKMI
jgi:hypothetical protein